MTPAELAAYPWEPDPNVFIFKENIPGKVKMGTKPLELKDWILIDSTYPDQMKLRYDLLKNQYDDVFVTEDTDETTDAKWELLDVIVAHLVGRYPKLFVRTEGGVLNRVTGVQVSTERDGGEDPIIRASRLTQDDWCVMMWDEEMQAYKLTAGVVTFPMRWSLRDKFQRPMAEIHKPVKPFGDHLVKQVYSLFRMMKPSNPIWRANWALFNDLKGPLDLYTPSGHEERNEVNQTTVYRSQEQAGKEILFRAEYQTLRKLEKSGAIIFGIRTYQRHLSDFDNLPIEDSKDLLSAIETLDHDFYIYKGTEFWEKASIQYLKTSIEQRQGKEFSPVLTCGMLAGAIAMVYMIYKRFS